ncbi:MAG: hypothetical protein AB1724_05455 [Thermodesulfobacteriota bacterium]
MFPASSKIWLVNLALAVAVVLTGIMSLEVWTGPDEMIPEIEAVADTAAPSPEVSLAARGTSPEGAYSIVVEKNLFSPDRSDPLAAGAGPGRPRLSEKNIYLYGIVILDGRTQALVSDPESGTRAAGARAGDKWVRVGDRIGNFSVAEIGRDRIVLKDGADRYDVLLYDENKPVSMKSEELPPATPTVVVTGSDKAAPEAAPDAPAAPAERAAAEKGPSSSSAFAPGSPAGSGEKPGEYKIVDTPFGPIKRRVE